MSHGSSVKFCIDINLPFGKRVGQIEKFSSKTKKSMGIRVRIGPEHPLACREGRLNGVVLRMRQENLNRGPMSQ
jgi:hypothetical protein